METIYIYGLFDPRTLELRYIGKTINPDARLKDHIKEAKMSRENTHKANWIRQILSVGVEPIIEVLEECTKNNWQEIEKTWIKECKEQGLRLTNITEGGENPPNFNELSNKDEVRKKMSKTRKKLGIKPPSWAGKKHTEQTKKRQSRSIRAYYKNNDHPSKGIPKTKEHIEKIIATKTKKGTLKKDWTEEYSKDEVKAIYQKRTDNEAWRNNLSKSAKKRLSDPTKNVMYGKKHTPESIAKNRLSNEIYAAYKKGEYDYVAELQEEFKQLAGNYQPNYAEFCYA